MARAAAAREDWADAHARLLALEEDSLEPSDLVALADASWWLGDQDASVEVRTRAYSALVATGRESDAAFQAGMLGIEHLQRGEPALGMGWLQRAHRHLDDRPEERAHGFLAGVESTVARFGGHLETAMALASTAAAIGRRTHDPDVWALGLHSIGLIHIAAGRIDEGVPLLDEAMTSVLAGELSSYFTGVVYCNVIEACLQIADVSRAGQWSEAAERWCASIPPESPFPGLCRVNRAHVADLRGEWSDAVAEAERASEQLLRFDPSAAGAAAYGSGEIHRRTGNVAEAERWFARARELGFDPEPGAALIHARRGGAASALASLRVIAGQDDVPPLRRARLLAALVDVAIEAGDREGAASASVELDRLADRHPVGALRALALGAAGQVALAAGAAAEALTNLRGATALWQELRLPYETACARVLVGTALRALGNEEGADLELRAALGVFERLGARPDAERVLAQLEPASLPRGLTPREAEVLRLVAAGMSNRDIAAALVISEHTVARHLQNLFAKIDVTSRSAATAFAFEHGLV